MLSPQHCSQLQSPRDRLFSKCSASHPLVYTHRHMLRTLPSTPPRAIYKVLNDEKLVTVVLSFRFCMDATQLAGVCRESRLLR